MTKRIAGLILAAGHSSRMGELKALLPFGADNVIVNEIKCLMEADISDIYIVVGYQADQIRSALNDYPVKFILNERYDDGMFSSIKAGLKAIEGFSFDGFFLIPVDFPLIRPFTLLRLMNEFENGTGSIIYPSYQFKKGHPPLISSKYIDAILNYDGDGGLKGSLMQFNDEAVYVLNGNDTILIDIDTKQEYQEALSYGKKRSIPLEDECEFIFNLFNVSERVIKHGKAVGEIARSVASLLNDRGFKMDLDLVYWSGLLHDFRKGTPLHAEAVAKTLNQMGYPRVGRIVENHMDIKGDYLNRICEESVIYYADKLLKETEIIPIEDRLVQIEQKSIIDPNVSVDARKRILNAKKVQDQIENVIGTSVIDWLRR